MNCLNPAGGDVPGLRMQPEPFDVRYEQAFSHPPIYLSTHPSTELRSGGRFKSPHPPAVRVALQLSCCEGSMIEGFDPGW